MFVVAVGGGIDGWMGVCDWSPTWTYSAVFGYRYLTGKIQEGEAHNITCPGFECSKLVAVDIIETLVSRDMARRYLQFDIKVRQFVNISYTIQMALVLTRYC